MYKILWYHLVSLNIIGIAYTRELVDFRIDVHQLLRFLGDDGAVVKVKRPVLNRRRKTVVRTEGGRRENQIRPVIRMRLDDPLMMGCWDRPPAGLPNFR